MKLRFTDASFTCRNQVARNIVSHLTVQNLREKRGVEKKKKTERDGEVCGGRGRERETARKGEVK